MAGHKVVIKYQDGKIMKGWVQNFKPERGAIMVNPLAEYSQEEKLEIRVSGLKAVFFVKDFIGNSTFQKAKTFENYPYSTPTQRHIIVYFKDGEKLYGTSYSYNPNKDGFFVYPIDPMDNNIRIFVLKDATENIEFP
jgi:small nuclear ribonucleoprotein (snRNP)-like protein